MTMSNTRKHWMLISLAVLFVAAPWWSAVAQETPAKPEAAEEDAEDDAPKMDDVSQAAIEKYTGLLYRLPSEGVKKASYTMKVSLDTQMGPMKATAAYKWDGKKGVATWDDPALEQMLAGQGLGVEQLDAEFKEGSFLASLAGAKLTGEKAEDGTVTVKVEGESKSSIQSMEFGANGLVVTQVVAKDVGTGTKSQITVKPEYRQEGKKYLVTSTKSEFEYPGMGTFTQNLTVKFVKHGEFWVSEKVTMANSLAGSPLGGMILEFSDWKLDDEVE